jgi:hypothetical protein
MAIESLVRKKYFLTSEQSLSKEGAKYVVLKVACIERSYYFIHIQHVNYFL